MLNKISEIHENNPKAYWDMLSKLRNDRGKKVPSDLISPDTWIDHFNSLNNNNDTFTDRIQTIKQQVENLEKLRCFNELDMIII